MFFDKKSKTAEEAEKEEERVLSPEEKSKKQLRGFLEIILELVIVAALVFLFLRFVAFRSVVQGSSMTDTLRDQDNLVVERVSYYFHEPRRFDIVVFRVPENTDSKEHYIKRVIGLPGETVEIISGKVYIDGYLLEEDVYGKELMRTGYNPDSALLDYGPVTVPEGEVFVLGDNRNDSKDSVEIGTIPEKKILGRVFFRFWPLKSWKKF